MNRIRTLIFSLFFTSCLYLQSQVLPPSITCITNDTIFYQPVSNTCGSFISYDVYTSNNPNGPFTLLETITDELATFIEHPNSSSQPAFYYMAPNFDCPGQTALNTDTISNRPPEAAVLQTVNVVNNEIVLTWDLSPSPETVLYSVFLLTDSGLELLIDTPDDTYIDTVHDPNVSTFSYLIVAVDACGNKSIFGDPASSVFLTTEITPCVDEVNFTWNKHINAQLQELWAITSDGSTTLISTLDPDAESFTLSNIPNIDITAFFIRGYINGDQNKIADSNLNSVSNEVTVMMDEIFFTRVSTQNENNIAVEWCWNQDADLSKYEIQYFSSSNSGLEEEIITSALSANESAQISANNTATEVTTLSIITIDECDQTFTADEIETSLLTVAPLSEGQLEIKWNAFRYPGAMLSQYEVHEVINGVDNIIYEGSNNQLLHPIPIDVKESCYYVYTTASGILNDASIKEMVIESNTACSKGFPIIRMPNAFNPYGVNNIFKPLVANTDAIVSYQMKIFSRYGQLLFETDKYEKGWNGRTGLTEMPQGVYAYLVEVEVLGGENINLQGNVLLIR